MLHAHVLLVLSSLAHGGSDGRVDACPDSSAAQVSARHQCDGNCTPPYPPALVRRRLEGEVVLLLEVSDSGKVKSASVHRSSGHGELDDAALRSVLIWATPRAIAPKPPGCYRIEEQLRYELPLGERLTMRSSRPPNTDFHSSVAPRAAAA